ncbi:MAG: Antidote-toxin recognition MazE, bacterial antitoxin [Solirubrobacterales bacterium]|jgi:AbrB family looped-hinge helix DNA binding protein|nr:Antidote-toxin recognition MazE, bacterial antitoxin [Solirubrobacterales bacterium]
MDNSGRITIPKALREHLHLRAGDRLDIELRDEVIRLRRAPRHVTLVRGRHGLLVAAPESDLPPTSLQQILDAIDEARQPRS